MKLLISRSHKVFFVAAAAVIFSSFAPVACNYLLVASAAIYFPLDAPVEFKLSSFAPVTVDFSTSAPFAIQIFFVRTLRN